MKKNDRFVACDTFCDSFMRPGPDMNKNTARNDVFFVSGFCV